MKQLEVKGLLRSAHSDFLLRVTMTVWLAFPFFLPSFEGIAQEKSSTYRVMIDPGHGGRDPGKLSSDENRFPHEKEIVLKIAKKVAAYVNERLPNAEARLTRYTDSTVSLESRAWQANVMPADVFVSIHCNSNPLRDIKGSRIHIQSTDFQYSLKLAKLMRHQFANRARRYDMGLHNYHDRGFNLYVLKYTNMPAVLVEVGFLSHPDEERYLNSEYGQDIVASAIFRALRSFRKVIGK